MPKIFHVACSVDNNYIQHCTVMLLSLFEKNKGHCFYIHLLVTEISNENIDLLQNVIANYFSKCRIYRIDITKLLGVKFRENNPLTYAAYSRLLLSSLLDDSIENVLYLDTDIIVQDDISSIFELDLGNDFALAAVKDLMIPTEEHRFQLGLPYDWDYFCSGVMFINLKYWRLNDSEKKLLSFAKKDRYVFYHDQDALNFVFKGRWYKLDPKWNCISTASCYNSFFTNNESRLIYERYPTIIHFAGIKPWFNIHFVKYRSLYYRYLKMTPWSDFKPIKYKDSYVAIYLYILSTYIHNFLYKYNLYSFYCLIKDIILYPYSKIKK